MPRIRPVLDQVNVVVTDMPAAVDFYRRLGMEVQDTGPEWDGHHRAVDTGGLDMDLDSAAFAAVWDRGWPRATAGVVLGFRVQTREQVDELYADLTGAGHAGQQEPYDAFWGARYAVVADPSGNAVGIMSPIDPARRSPQDPPD